MKKQVFMLLLSIITLSHVSRGDNIIPYKDGNKWGYINTAGKIIVKAYYDYADNFNEGYSVVRLGEKYAILNTKGEMIIPFSNRVLYGFHNGLCRFSLNEKYGFINEKDSLIVQPLYDYANNCRNDFILVGFKNNDNDRCTYHYCILYYKQNKLIKLKHKDPYCSINKENTFIPPYCDNDKIYVTIKHKRNMIIQTVFDTLGNKVLENNKFKPSCNGVFIIQKLNIKKYNFQLLYGINTLANKVLLKPQYTILECLRNGSFVAQKKGEKELFFISANGNKIINEGFDSIFWSFNNSMGLVCKEKKWYMINEKGNKTSLPNNVIPNLSYFSNQRSNFQSLSSDLIPVVVNNNDVAFMNYSMEIIKVQE